MGGFPARASRVAFGPTFVNTFPVRDPAKEPGAAMVNLLAWQAAGMAQVTPKVALTCTVAGGVISAPVFYGLTFDPDSETTPITFTYEAAGRYSFAFSQNYPDENGTDISLSLVGGMAIPIQRNQANGSHDATSGPSLIDSSQSWTINAFVGDIVYNLTDGSMGVITSNSATSVAATLAGGTDNDWDSGDEYAVVSLAREGWVHLLTNYSGEVYMADSDNTLVDCSTFLLLLW